jgi:hypothetical protein
MLTAQLMKTLVFRQRAAFFSILLISFIVVSSLDARATENGVSGYPVGIETVLTGIHTPPGQTSVQEFTSYYASNEFDDAHGKSLPIVFKVRVFVTAFKVNHNWGWRLLGGTIESQLAAPLIYEQLHVAPGKVSKYGLGNADIVPACVAYNHKDMHWYYEADLGTRGAAYRAADTLNVGQHNLSITPAAGFTYLPNKGATELSSRVSYVFNGPNKSTGYHSGNELIWEYNADQRFAQRRFSVGINGAYYQQTTGDTLHGISYQGGFKGRDLLIGPQIRFPLGHNGGFTFKYYRDTLVQNKSRGNSLWFEISAPLSLSR